MLGGGEDWAVLKGFSTSIVGLAILGSKHAGVGFMVGKKELRFPLWRGGSQVCFPVH